MYEKCSSGDFSPRKPRLRIPFPQLQSARIRAPVIRLPHFALSALRVRGELFDSSPRVHADASKLSPPDPSSHRSGRGFDDDGPSVPAGMNTANQGRQLAGQSASATVGTAEAPASAAGGHRDRPTTCRSDCGVPMRCCRTCSPPARRGDRHGRAAATVVDVRISTPPSRRRLTREVDRASVSSGGVGAGLRAVPSPVRSAPNGLRVAFWIRHSTRWTCMSDTGAKSLTDRGKLWVRTVGRHPDGRSYGSRREGDLATGPRRCFRQLPRGSR